MRSTSVETDASIPSFYRRRPEECGDSQARLGNKSHMSRVSAMTSDARPHLRTEGAANNGCLFASRATRQMSAPRALSIARIDEAACIGCTLCIAACPVDAIVGAAKLMHTVLVERCTGCELCVPPCPVDCITLAPVDRAWARADADLARARFAARAQRLERQAGGRYVSAAGARASSEDTLRERRQAAVSAALARARARRAARSQSDSQS